jgi:hypothetical protein
MKASTFLVLFLLSIFHVGVECAKNYSFVELESCKSNNEVVLIKKCEIDGIYISITVDIKVPITKAMVSHELL